MDERVRQFISFLPLNEKVSLKTAAVILQDDDAVYALLNEVAQGHLFSWAHSPSAGPASVLENRKHGLRSDLPPLTADTDPAQVFIEGREVQWRWCVAYEARKQLVALPSKASVEAREVWVLEQARGAVQPVPTARPKPVLLVQEDRILELFRELGQDPLAVPKTRGKRGVKADIRDRALQEPLFTDSSFAATWERLRAGGRIKDMSAP